MISAVVAVALITSAVLVFRGDGGSTEAGGSPTPTTTESSAEPLPTDSGEPEDYPPDDYPTDDYPTEEESPRDFEDIMPTPSDGPRPAFQMDVGDCFDIAEGQGQGEPVECSAAHDAEVVHQEKLDKEYDTDSAVRERADALCEGPMRDAAQGESTVGGTLVQYPKASGVRMGMRTVTCSLTAGEGQKLYDAL
ncbi:septum formation family protein [Streptomyces oceani]|uniref:septum formation family protein n=1 Tax=Streptomyces oceani TaxID=1075402 RepID=UPI001BAED9CC|nr:septum formation family protein [Streptomyces oceani]